MTRPITRRSLILAGAATPALFLLPQPALAAKPPIYTDGGFAIRGTDPVAYFTEGKDVRGDEANKLKWMGATWLFASAANMKTFEANPEAYAPKYGGYCAYAVSKGGTASTEPDAWTIVDDRLYLNYNKTVRGIWSEDIPGNIARADANWPKVLEA